jgi:pimeloyl-ACP methyl ester carboxylesterase
MSTYLLVPGAGGAAWYWHRVAALLDDAGHDATPVELPGDDPRAGLPEYADLVVAAGDGHDGIVLVAQSMGAFTALPACARLPVRRLVLNNAMIPLPGETAGDWWEHTGSAAARVAAARDGGYDEAFDIATYFLHDVPSAVAAAGAEHQRPEADVAFGQPCASTAGRPCRRRCSRAATIVSSRWRSSGGWRASAWDSGSRRCRVGISMR